MLAYGLKFMGIEYGWFRMNGYEDMNDNVNSQNGAWMTSRLSDHVEKLNVSIPDQGKDTVKISTWLLILFLRYHGPKIHTVIKEKETIKIRTDTIGDMPLCGISPNYIKYSLLSTTSESLNKIRQRIRKLQLFEI